MVHTGLHRAFPYHKILPWNLPSYSKRKPLQRSTSAEDAVQCTLHKAQRMKKDAEILLMYYFITPRERWCAVLWYSAVIPCISYMQKPLIFLIFSVCTAESSAFSCWHANPWRSARTWRWWLGKSLLAKVSIFPNSSFLERADSKLQQTVNYNSTLQLQFPCTYMEFKIWTATSQFHIFKIRLIQATRKSGLLYYDSWKPKFIYQGKPSLQRASVQLAFSSATVLANESLV